MSPTIRLLALVLALGLFWLPALATVPRQTPIPTQAPPVQCATPDAAPKYQTPKGASSPCCGMTDCPCGCREGNPCLCKKHRQAGWKWQRAVGDEEGYWWKWIPKQLPVAERAAPPAAPPAAVQVPPPAYQPYSQPFSQPSFQPTFGNGGFGSQPARGGRSSRGGSCGAGG